MSRIIGFDLFLRYRQAAGPDVMPQSSSIDIVPAASNSPHSPRQFNPTLAVGYRMGFNYLE